MENIQPISASLAAMVPTAIVSIFCLAIWFGGCRRLRPGEAGTLLFMKSTITLATLGAVYLGAMLLGVTPANQAEREFIAMVRHSDLSKKPVVSASLKVVDRNARQTSSK